MTAIENSQASTVEVNGDNVNSYLDQMKLDEKVAPPIAEETVQSSADVVSDHTDADTSTSVDTLKPVSNKPTDHELAQNYKSAMMETRGKNKELNQRLAKTENENRVYRQRMEELQEKASAGGDIDLKAEIENLKAQNQSSRAQAEYNNEFKNFVGEYQTQADNFKRTSPDFTDAYDFLISSRQREFEAMGYNLQQSNEMLHNEELAIVSKAFQDGEDAAERIYRVAKARGYVAHVAPTVDRIGMYQNGVRANKVLSSGTEVESEPSYERLARLVDEGDMTAFNAEFDRMAGGTRRPF